MSMDPRTADEERKRQERDTSRPDIDADHGSGNADIRVDEAAGVGGPDIKPEP